jgi:hypothetical protein
MVTQGSPSVPHVAAMVEAFDAVWTMLCERDRSQDPNRLATELREKLAALVADGVTDPAELEKLILDSFPFVR